MTTLVPGATAPAPNPWEMPSHQGGASTSQQAGGFMGGQTPGTPTTQPKPDATTATPSLTGQTTYYGTGNGPANQPAGAPQMMYDGGPTSASGATPGLIDLTGQPGGDGFQMPTKPAPGPAPAVAQWNVDPNQTVEGRLTGLLDSNNPLMQRAETRALQAANSRGLLNSSMAVGAGQAALYDAAMPIATQDANTHAASAQWNADAKNKAIYQNMDIASREFLETANIEANNYLANLNISAQQRSQFLQQQSGHLDTYAKAVAAINSNPDTTTAQKDAAIKNAMEIYKTGLQLSANLAGINLSPGVWADPFNPDTNTPSGKLVKEWNDYWAAEYPPGTTHEVFPGGNLTKNTDGTATLSVGGKFYLLSANSNIGDVAKIPGVAASWQQQYGI